MTWRRVLPWIGLAMVLGVGAWFIHGHRESFALAGRAAPIDLAVLTLYVIVPHLCAGYGLCVSARMFGVRLPFREWFGLQIVATYGNYLPFRAGLGIQGVYLKKRHDLPYSRFVSLTTAAFAIGFAEMGFLAIICVLLAGGGGDPVAVGATLAFFVAVTLVGLLPFLARAPRVPATGEEMGRIRLAWVRVREGWSILRAQPAGLAVLAACRLGAVLAVAFRLEYVLRVIGQPQHFTIVLPAVFAASVARMTAIFPGALGLREAVVGLVLAALGASGEMGVVAATLDRAVVMFWIFLLGNLFSVVLWRGGPHGTTAVVPDGSAGAGGAV